MRQKKTRKIVEGAAISAIFGTLFLIDMYSGGLFGYYLYFILPTLIVWYGYKYELKDSLTLSIAIFFITLFVASPLSLYYAISALLAGIVIGYCVKKKVNATTLFLVTTTITLLSNILMYTMFSKLFEMDLISEATSIYHMVEGFMPSGSMIALDIFLQFVPLVIFFMGIIEAYVMILLMMLILPRLKVPFSFRFNFLLMQFPKGFGIISLLIIGMNYFIEGGLLLHYLDVILKTILIVQGASLVGLYFTLNKKIVFYFLSMLLVIIPYVWYIYGILGFIDIMIGIKKKLLYNKHKQ